MRSALKFGGDFSVYPGDPELYHAIFSVRAVHRDQLLRPSHLAGAARGVHSARKHYVLAYLAQEPEDDCGSKSLPTQVSFAVQCAGRFNVVTVEQLRYSQEKLAA